MLDLLYTEAEERFRQELRDFLNKELAPLMDKGEQKVSREFLRKLGGKGYMGSLYPKEVGGTGRGIIYDTLVSDEVAYLDPATDASRSLTCVMAAAPLYRFGTREQQEKYLRPLITGQAIGAIAISEPSAGSDAAGMQTRAQRRGDFYIINGQKHWISNGSVADYILLFAITNPETHAHQGMSAFIVETNTPGFQVLRDPPVLGLRGMPHSHLRFEDMAVPITNRVGKENDGWHVLTDQLASERINIAGRIVGCARRLYEEAVKHSATREQFGRKIRSFEGISFQIAEMKCDLDAARLLLLRAARLYDSGVRVEKEAAIAKVFAAEHGFKIADRALQIHAGYGYCADYVVEKFFRDIRAFRLGGGTDEILKYLIQREEYRDFGY